MPSYDIQVKGVEQLRAVGRALRTHGDRKAIQKELYRGINTATRPLVKDVRKSAKTRLPKRGGLARRISSSKILRSKKVSGAGIGVKIVGRSGYDISSINRGRVRHLTFGHLPWENQSVTPKFWDAPLEAGAPAVRRELLRVLDDIARSIVK